MRTALLEKVDPAEMPCVRYIHRRTLEHNRFDNVCPKQLVP